MWSLSTSLLLVVAAFNVAFGGLLPNGNFETIPKPTDLSGTKLKHPNAIPNWETSGFVEFINQGTKQGDMLLVVPEGKYAVRLGNEASIRQKVQTKKGYFYALTFSFGRTCAQEEKLHVSVSPSSNSKPRPSDTDSAVLPLQTMYTSVGFDSYAWGFLAKADQVEITLHNPRIEDDPACGPLVDTVAINILRPPRPTRGNLVKNGDFEEGPFVFHKSSWGVLIPPKIEDDHSPLPAWIVESLKAVNYIDSAHYSVPQGKRAVELVGGIESALTQIIRTVKSTNYVLSFTVGDANNNCVGLMAVEAFADGSTLRVDYVSKGKGGFKRGILRFKANSSRTRIRFLSSNYIMKVDGSLCGPVVDDVKVLVDRTTHRLK